MISFFDIKTFFLTAPQEEWGEIISIFDGNSIAAIKFVRTASPSSLKREIEIKRIGTEQTGIKSWGLANLIAQLSELDEHVVLDIQELSTKKWIGLCVSEKSKAKIIGCAFVENRKSTMKTPPNWDGSIEDLNKFNEPDKNKEL